MVLTLGILYPTVGVVLTLGILYHTVGVVLTFGILYRTIGVVLTLGILYHTAGVVLTLGILYRTIGVFVTLGVLYRTNSHVSVLNHTKPHCLSAKFKGEITNESPSTQKRRFHFQKNHIVLFYGKFIFVPFYSICFLFCFSVQPQ